VLVQFFSSTLLGVTLISATLRNSTPSCFFYIYEGRGSPLQTWRSCFLFGVPSTMQWCKLCYLGNAIVSSVIFGLIYPRGYNYKQIQNSLVFYVREMLMICGQQNELSFLLITVAASQSLLFLSLSMRAVTTIFLAGVNKPVLLKREA
jgi:hypothetical protein